MEGDNSPGGLPVASGVMCPMQASIDTRPCSSSVARRCLKFSSEPLLVKPRGSQRPAGGCTPSSDSFGLEWGLGVARPVAQSGAGEATLEEQANSCHHVEAPAVFSNGGFQLRPPGA